MDILTVARCFQVRYTHDSSSLPQTHYNSHACSNQSSASSSNFQPCPPGNLLEIWHRIVDDPVQQVWVRFIHIWVIRIHLFVGIIKHGVSHDGEIYSTHFLKGFNCSGNSEVEMAKASKSSTWKNVIFSRFYHWLLEPSCSVPDCFFVPGQEGLGVLKTDNGFDDSNHKKFQNQRPLQQTPKAAKVFRDAKVIQWAVETFQDVFELLMVILNCLFEQCLQGGKK